MVSVRKNLDLFIGVVWVALGVSLIVDEDIMGDGTTGVAAVSVIMGLILIGSWIRRMRMS